MADRFLDPVDGHDGNDGLTALGPWLTLDFALGELAPGDNLKIVKNQSGYVRIENIYWSFGEGESQSFGSLGPGIVIELLDEGDNVIFGLETGETGAGYSQIASSGDIEAQLLQVMGGCWAQASINGNDLQILFVDGLVLGRPRIRRTPIEKLVVRSTLGHTPQFSSPGLYVPATTLLETYVIPEPEEAEAGGPRRPAVGLW